MNRLRIDRELNALCDRVVIAGVAVTEQDLFNDLFPVDGILSAVRTSGLSNGATVTFIGKV